MRKSRLPALVLAAMLMPLSLAAAPQVNKCTINGVVSYQRDPCPTGEARSSPTAAQLNAERQRKLRQAAASAAQASAPAPSSTGQPGSAGVRTAPLAATFKCDGRKHCSQMTSCAEAKQFLAHCPGVEMDGDRDGIPCEQQWCNR